MPISASRNETLDGKNVLITGGSLGIGLATARACLERGARVTIVARTSEQLAAAAAELAEIAGAPAIATASCDVSNNDDLPRVFDLAESRFGKIDSVVHAAGIYGPIGSITDVDPVAWFEAIRVNLFGTFLVARAACERMKKSGGGRIVLFSGGGASGPFPNYTAYATSKIAVVRFAETIALEMAPFDIEVNVLAPGFVPTRLHEQTLAAGEAAGDAFLETTRAQLEKGGVPASVPAATAAFLLSDRARGITGKFVAAPYDGWSDWPAHLAELQATDIFTLRRILPKERGMNWQ